MALWHPIVSKITQNGLMGASSFAIGFTTAQKIRSGSG
jgi:hypothetical protein